MKVIIEKVKENAVIPSFANKTDAGLDLISTESYIVNPGDRALVSTGIRIQLPSHTEAQIRPRSGLALKYGVTVLNTPGTIDEGYRGEIGVIIINHGTDSFHISEGDRVAQMVIKPLLSFDLEEGFVETSSERGEGGFGSSGIKSE